MCGNYVFFKFLTQQTPSTPPHPQWAMASSFTRFLDHKQRRTTVGRTAWTSDQPVAETST